MDSDRARKMAIASLVIGIIALLAWCLPCCGFPVTIVGIVLGALGVKSEQKVLAIIGIVLNVLGLVASVANAAFGAYTGITGNNPLVPGFAKPEPVIEAPMDPSGPQGSSDGREAYEEPTTLPSDVGSDEPIGKPGTE